MHRFATVSTVSFLHSTNPKPLPEGEVAEGRSGRGSRNIACNHADPIPNNEVQAHA
jgi:hypothetical protein